MILMTDNYKSFIVVFYELRKELAAKRSEEIGIKTINNYLCWMINYFFIGYDMSEIFNE